MEGFCRAGHIYNQHVVALHFLISTLTASFIGRTGSFNVALLVKFLLIKSYQKQHCEWISNYKVPNFILSSTYMYGFTVVHMQVVLLGYIYAAIKVTHGL